MRKFQPRRQRSHHTHKPVDEAQEKFFAGTVVDPSQRIRLEEGCQELTMRAMDLICPSAGGVDSGCVYGDSKLIDTIESQKPAQGVPEEPGKGKKTDRRQRDVGEGAAHPAPHQKDAPKNQDIDAHYCQ